MTTKIELGTIQTCKFTRIRVVEDDTSVHLIRDYRVDEGREWNVDPEAGLTVSKTTAYALRDLLGKLS